MTEPVPDVHRNRLSRGIQDWIVQLDDYPGWKEWNRSKISRTLHFDDEFRAVDEHPGKFDFDPETERQHDLIMRYFTLLQTPAELRDLQYYFRRFPLAGTPVTRYAHLSNVCELYFNRIYQYRERLKKLFEALKASVPKHRIDVGKLIKDFDKEFDAEIRERHSVHHRERFEDLEISRVFLIESILLQDKEFVSMGWDREYRLKYRRLAKVWAKRCVDKADRLDAFTEAVAGALLRICPFLVPTTATDTLEARPTSS